LNDRPEPPAAPDYLELPLGEFLDLVAAGAPAPAGGSVAAVAVSLAAGLAGMTARLSTNHLADAPDLTARADRLRKRAALLAREDAEAYGRFMAARRAKDADAGAALSEAADVPLSVADIGAEVAGISARLMEEGNPNLRGDALAAVLLAESGTRAAAHLARINLALGDVGDGRTKRAEDLAEKAAASRRAAEDGGLR
jgi:methenyltetrahydrofolate cyclohydrolase